MTTSNFDKGRQLEKAVGLIQESILRSDPEMKGCKFSIARNQKITVNDVLHEIDVLVKTFPGSKLEATYLYECKNWSASVGKKEVMELAGKVDALGANRGFLVARQFSQYARAQAKLSPRVTLLHFTDDFSASLSIEATHLIHEPTKITLEIRDHDLSVKNNPPPFEWEGKPCYYQNEPVPFCSFIDSRIREMLNEYNKLNLRAYHEQRNHFGQFTYEFTFAKGELRVGARDIQWMQIHNKFFVNFQKLKPVSTFELNGLGRTASFKIINETVAEQSIELDLVLKP